MSFKTLFILLFSQLLFLFSACQKTQQEPEILSITDEETLEYKDEDLVSIAGETPDDLELSIWAAEALLGDPIAIDMDDQGRAWVTVTNRSRNSEFDIRDVDSGWLIESMKWETVEDRREFLRTELAPEKSDENTWLTDHNNDGSHDWRDLTVMKEEIWRLEDETGNGTANRSQLYIRDFHDEVTDVAGAVLHHNNETFIGVGPDMWRTRDTNNDGMADWKESISHGYNVHIGFSGHGMSGLTMGPDGRVYWGIGDMGFSVEDQDGKTWHYPNQGAILRSEPDGSNFEVFAAGLRNTHEFTFDKFGNLITVDNDGDHAGEHERIAYLVNGSDSGWRTNWQFGKYTDDKNNSYKVWMDEDYFKPRWEGQAAHVLPPLGEFHAGPAGMSYNPGTALNENWKDHFFVMSFQGSVSNSSIFAFTLKENGASYEPDTETEVLSGVLAVGLDFGPDGALYMTDWVEGWSINGKGRIWKLDVPDDTGSDIRLETKELLAQSFEELSSDVLMQRMEHEDMRVRQKAQFEFVAREDAESLLITIQESENQLARVHGIWGIGQLGRSNAGVVEPLFEFLEDPDYEIRAQVAKILGDVRYKPAGSNLVTLLEDEHPRVRYFATEALGRIGHSDAFQNIVDMLERNDEVDVYLRHAGAIALARFQNGKAIAELADHPSKAVRIAAIVALKQLEHPGSARFLHDEDEYIVTNAARAISDDAFVDEAMPALAEMLGQGNVTNEPFIRRAINANLYSGRSEDAKRLAEFALHRENDELMQVEALNTLKFWDEPSIFDRVTGRHRGQIQNSADDAREALAGVIDSILEDRSENVKVAAIGAAAELMFTPVIPTIYAQLQNAQSPDTRVASLRALRDLHYDEIDEAIQVALLDKSESVRMAALLMIPTLDIDNTTAVALLETAFMNGSVQEKQSALVALEELEGEETYTFMHNLFDRLETGELAQEVHLEFLSAVESMDSDALNERLTEYEASRSGDPVSRYSEALKGGNASEGRSIFYQHAAAQCIRCHAVAGSGAEVGPELTSISNILSREQLLESMVAPSARIAPGYGVVTLTLQDGETVRGVLEEENAQQMVLREGEQRHVVDKSDIQNQTTTPSSMPDMSDILTMRELRDLVEFMTTLDGSEK